MNRTSMDLPQLERALEVLFGPGHAPSGLNEHAAKKAFRKRAFETHPDHLVHAGAGLCQPGEKFCAAGMRSGFLDSFMTMALLGRQRILQPKVGEYFTFAGILDAEALDRALTELALRKSTLRR